MFRPRRSQSTPKSGCTPASPSHARVLVLGCPGSGKTTFARKLAHAIDCASFSMDDVIGVADTRVPQAEWAGLVSGCTDAQSWVFDGNVIDTLEIRAARATHVVLLTTPRLICLWRVWRRRKSPDAPVPFSLPLARYVLRYGRSRSQHLAVVREHSQRTIMRVSGRDTDRARRIVYSQLVNSEGDT